MTPEDFHRLVFEGADIGIFMTDPSGRLKDANLAMAKMLGYPSVKALKQAAGSSNERFYVDPAIFAAHGDKLRKYGRLSNEVSEMIHADGRNLWISQSASVYGEGADAVVIGTAIDITALVKSQQALRAAEERYRSLFENAIVGTYISSLDGRMISANQALARINGYETPEELIRQVNDIATEWYVDPKRRSEFVRLIGRDGIVRSFESEIYRHKTRERIWISENARLVRDANGIPQHYEGTVEDITSRKNFERQLMLARREAESSNRAKTEFLASMSHELRTPLNAIMGFSELIGLMTRDSEPQARIHEYAEDILSSARILFHLIEEILDYSKLESGKTQIEESEVNLAEIVQQCTTMLAGRAAKGDIALVLQTPANLPRVRGDKRRLLQIALNLLTNAVKFTPAGGKVTVTIGRSADGGVSLIVADTGIGIPARDLERVFEPFVQANRQAFHQQEGTGLGLAICRSLIELHQGRIAISSQVGAGTKVHVTLPPERVIPGSAAASQIDNSHQRR